MSADHGRDTASSSKWCLTGSRHEGDEMMVLICSPTELRKLVDTVIPSGVGRFVEHSGKTRGAPATSCS